MTHIKTATVVAIVGATTLLGGCSSLSSLNTWLSQELADKIPKWAGGLPPDVPPRESDPHYVDYRHAVEGKSSSEMPNGTDPLH